MGSEMCIRDREEATIVIGDCICVVKKEECFAKEETPVVVVDDGA